jgi:hypothetical protein
MTELKNRPIYYCTDLSKETTPKTGADIEDYMGEYIEDASFMFYEIKSGEEKLEDISSDLPYFPTEIKEDLNDCLNVGESAGSYYREEGPSLDEYQTAYGQMINQGMKPEDITAQSLKKYVKEHQVKETVGKAL